MRSHPAERSRPAARSRRPVTPPEGGLDLFLRELKRRRVPHVAGLYLVGAFAVVQALLMAFDAFDLPRAASRATIILAVAGAPVAVLLAWMYELRPLQVRREARLARGPLAARVRTWAWATFAVLVVAALAIGVASLWRLWRPAPAPRSPTATMAPDRVAVLYFRDESPGGANRYVAAAMTETLISDLTGAGGLTVISSAGVEPYRDTPVRPDSLAKVLDVGTIVTGAVTGAGDLVRIIVQLVDARTNRVLESSTIDGSGRELLQLVDRVVREVSLRIRERVGDAVQLRQWHAGTASDTAWALVQRANQLRRDGWLLAGTKERAGGRRMLARADSLLAAAERADPQWPEPVVQRGWLQEVLANLAAMPGEGSDQDAAVAALQQGIEHAKRALARDPDNAAALELRGVLEYWKGSNEASFQRKTALYAAADSDLRAAVTRDPHRARAWSIRAIMRLGQADYTAARMFAERALHEDAYMRKAGEIVWTGFQSTFELSDDTAASTWCERLRLKEPAGLAPVLCRFQLMAWGARQPDPESAIALRLAATVEEPVDYNRATLDLALATVLARAGWHDSAEAVATRAHHPDLLYLLLKEAEVRVLLHQPAAAVALLRDYVAGDPARLRRVERARTFASLRARPDFARLVAAVAPER